MSGPLLRFEPDAFDRHRRNGWYETWSLADRVRVLAADRPDGDAYISELHRMTWREYDERSTDLACSFLPLGLEPGDRLGVFLPDGPAVHAVLLAAEKAGLVVVGIGPRAGFHELRHLLSRTGCRSVVTGGMIRDEPAAEVIARLRADGIPLDHHLVVPEDLSSETPVEVDGCAIDPADQGATSGTLEGRGLGPDDLFLLNSTSGTTGMPKCVMQHQNRWFYFHQLAARAGSLNQSDVVMSLVSAPYGFGLWTAHFTPALLGVPCIVMSRFSADGALELMERQRVTTLACVSTQFVMMLNSPELDRRDLTSLRVMFTGGEAVPYGKAAQFEERTGAAVLQFFGSNETGALSRTALSDTRDQRLRTAGRVIDEMEVRLFDDEGVDVTKTGGPGQPACRGPATCLGYFDDEEANAQLFTADGWMLTGDIATIDSDGYLRVVGRKSDFIIRGGKNISAVQVEAEVGSHPGVAMVAAVAKPDETFGERVCVFVVARAGHAVSLHGIAEHLRSRGLSRELFPEHLVLVDDLPQASGGKVAKEALRAMLR